MHDFVNRDAVGALIVLLAKRQIYETFIENGCSVNKALCIDFKLCF